MQSSLPVECRWIVVDMSFKKFLSISDIFGKTDNYIFLLDEESGCSIATFFKQKIFQKVPLKNIYAIDIFL